MLAEPGEEESGQARGPGEGPDAGPGACEIALSRSLLYSEPEAPPTTAEGGPWASGRAWLLLISLFVSYHLLAVIAHQLPGRGPIAGAKFPVERLLRTPSYLQATGNLQHWAMFAPNPFRENVAVRVLVRDAAGEEFDLAHDTQRGRTYPYLRYDRRAKINRRLASERRYLRPYAAFVCRQWARERGAPPEQVRFLQWVTALPSPAVAWDPPPELGLSWSPIGWDPRRLPVTRQPLADFACADLAEAPP